MNHRTKNRLYVQLGRTGDIINVLPLLRRDYEETGRRPAILVAAQFAELLDGVSYAVPYIFDGEFEDSLGAFRRAEQIAALNDLEIVFTQIYGRTIHTGEKCSSFVVESWARSPGSPPWGSLPLVFDRRDLSREVGVKNNLLQRVKKGLLVARPYVVLALAGTSSPFPESANLARYLRNKLGSKFDFIDISGFMAPRFYDLLTLLEGAHAIVTIDSAVLHLAAAVPEIPVVAFITRTPTPWHGTARRPQQVVRHYYDEAPECFAATAYWLEIARDTLAAPCFLHAWSGPEHGFDPETDRRLVFAHYTQWEEKRSSGVVWHNRCFRGDRVKRTSGDLGDPRPVPFVRDIIQNALDVDAEGVRPGDIIALTNADACFAPGLTGRVIDVVRRHGSAFTHRWDFTYKLGEPLSNEEQVQRGEWYPGSDAFFFTVAWWRKHRDEYPDMLLGREHVDEVLRQLIKRHGGLEVKAAIYHEKHASFWEDPDQKANAGNAHNRRLARKFFLKHGYGPNDPTWWRLP